MSHVPPDPVHRHEDAEAPLPGLTFSELADTRSSRSTSAGLTGTPAPGDRRTYRLRVDLRDTSPPVWRRLEVDADLKLDELHRVVQAAFGWTDSHLHCFSVGHPFDRDSTVFLCPFEVEDGDREGLDARTVRLDEVVVASGDVLHYMYDYGDGWHHTLRVEQVAGRRPGAPRAACVGGRRAGPPEDCGGVWGYEELAASGEVDGAAFDLARTDADVRAAATASAVVSGLPTLPQPTLEQMVDRVQWMLDRAEEDALPMTGAGWLAPAVVRRAWEDWDLGNEWIGAGNREAWTVPVLDVRELAQELRLIRRYKGRLRLAPAGRAVHGDRDGLRRLVDAAL